MINLEKFILDINANTSEFKKDFNSFIKFLKNNKFTVIITWFFILMAYGIKLFYHSISIDTEAIINNYDSQMNSWISIGRFGLILTKKIFRLFPFNVYVACFLMMCTMFLFSIFLSFLLNYLTFEENKGSFLTCIFPIVFLTSPLFAEQFNFILQGFEVAFAILLVSISAFLITRWVLDKKLFLYLLVGLFLLVWAFASYQAVVFLYVSIILACYYFIYNNHIKNKIILYHNFFKIAAIKYLITFIFGYVLYCIFNKVFTVGLGVQGYLNNMISWNGCNYFFCIRNIINYILSCKLYIIFSLILLYYSFINLFKKSKNKFIFFLVSICLVLSPFFLAIYLGHGLIARSQFSLQFVSAFALYFFVYQLKSTKILKFLIIAFSIFLSFNQSYKVSNYMYTDYMKYQSEVVLANKISDKIDYLNLKSTLVYPLIFIGSIHPLNTPIETRGEVIGSSFFEWDKEVEFGSNYRILGFMKTIGYIYKEPIQKEINKGKEIAKTMPSWPDKDSVIFKDNLIVVKLSD